MMAPLAIQIPANKPEIQSFPNWHLWTSFTAFYSRLVYGIMYVGLVWIQTLTPSSLVTVRQVWLEELNSLAERELLYKEFMTKRSTLTNTKKTVYGLLW